MMYTALHESRAHLNAVNDTNQGNDNMQGLTCQEHVILEYDDQSRSHLAYPAVAAAVNRLGRHSPKSQPQSDCGVAFGNNQGKDKLQQYNLDLNEQLLIDEDHQAAIGANEVVKGVELDCGKNVNAASVDDPKLGNSAMLQKHPSSMLTDTK